MPTFGERLKEFLRRKLTRNPFLRRWPAGHFYSPVPDYNAVFADRKRIFESAATELPGIDLNVTGQTELVRAFGELIEDQPFSEAPSTDSSGPRYGFANPFFSYGDAIALHGMLRHLRPKRVIEVGSGFSSAVMLDTNDLFLNGETQLTFVEPFPDRLQSLLRPEDKDRVTLVQGFVQNVPVERFQELGDHDVLFIDSSHVAKIGSDVVYLLTEVLPQLAPGVVVHVHDIFWPFEYPEAWTREGRAWNEAYLLKAFLQHNSDFEILFFNSYLALHQRPALEEHLALFLKNPGGSIWLRRV